MSVSVFSNFLYPEKKQTFPSFHKKSRKEPGVSPHIPVQVMVIWLLPFGFPGDPDPIGLSQVTGLLSD